MKQQWHGKKLTHAQYIMQDYRIHLHFAVEDELFFYPHFSEYILKMSVHSINMFTSTLLSTELS